MEETTKAYIAGIIDGEGYIGLQRYAASKVGLIPVVKVVTTDPILAPYLKQCFPSTMNTRRRNHRNKHWLDATEWAISGVPRVKQFLEAILPYLQIKKDQAQLILDYIEECGSWKGHRWRKDHKRDGIMEYDQSFVERRWWYHDEAKRLKTQYRAVAETKWRSP